MQIRRLCKLGKVQRCGMIMQINQGPKKQRIRFEDS